MHEWAVRLVGPEQHPVDLREGDDIDCGAVGQEEGQVLVVGADGVGAAGLVQRLPVQELLDGLGQGDGFARRIGIGGSCPHCDLPVAVTDLLDQATITTSTP
jgi:hypothetical protein